MTDQIGVDEDERDDLDQRKDPDPQASPPEFASPSDDPELVPSSSEGAFVSGITQVHVINRALPNEGVPGCRIVIGTESAVANRFGNATLDLRNLDDGSHAATFLAPDVSEDLIGPGFPAKPESVAHLATAIESC